MVVNVTASETTRNRLGSAFEKITDSLWGEDCQTCGRALNAASTPPSLTVDDMITTMRVSLHHPSCRAPEWSDSGPITLSSMPTLSHVSNPQGMRVGDDKAILMVTNPGLESIQITPTDGGWAVNTEVFAFAGLKPLPFQIGGAISGAQARLHGGDVSITMTVMPGETYSATVGAEGVEMIRSQGGVGWAITHALHPAEYEMADFARVANGGQLIAGWVELV